MPFDRSSENPVEGTRGRLALSAEEVTRGGRSAPLRRWVVVIGVIVIVANACAAVYDAWRSYRSSMADTGRELVNTAHLLAAQTAGTLQSVDVLLRDVADWYESAGDSQTTGIASELAARAAGLPWLLRLSISDAQGIQQYRSKDSIPVGTNISDRPYFIAQRDDSTLGLFVSEPIVTRSEGRDVIALSRRLNDRDGHFAGVVSGSIPLEYLQSFYRDINLGDWRAIALLRADGTLLVREPMVASAVGKPFPEVARLGRDAGNFALVSSTIDGVRRFSAGAPVAGFPLVVVVARDEASVLAPLREDATRVLVRTMILSLLGAIAIAALVRQLRRVDVGERALRESEERYALAMDAANEGHFDASLVGGPSFFSEKMRLLGIAPGEMFTSRTEIRAGMYVHPDDVPAIDAAFEAHIQGRTPRYELEFRAGRTESEWRWVHMRARAVRDSNGNPYRLIGTVADISERKGAEVEKERLETRLRKAQQMEAVGTLAGGIAHDFNNILGAILGYGEMAQKAAAPTTDLRRYIDNVMRAASRAKALVERILAFSRSGIGERSPVNAQAIVEETLELLAASLPPGVRLECKLEAPDVAVIGGATQLHQVVMNVCTNAVQAMKDGGQLEVGLERTSVSEAKSLSHGELVPGTYARLTVRDTGVGIEPAVLDRIFDPFFTTKSVGEGTGTGLGLSLVHGIVADMGGAIDVVSVPIRGTTFTIWLPTAPDSMPLPPVIADAELPRGNGQVVMVVDDEPVLVELAEEMLAELGYEPVGFVSSKTAFEAFSTDPQRFDFVLTDEMMPELAGTGLALEIRRARADIPIAIMTGYSDSGFATLARSAGVSEILRKPLRARDLAESLARILGVS
jgi:PAS domain S-box-containing protein